MPGPGPGDYTVGWICAVETEYVAARVLLDEIHETSTSVSHSDGNAYTFGRIGPHLVVVAVSPDGEYGTSSAAAVARNMMHSFPNIRVGLMVGIGGGAPSEKHDIRLGDVVVSAPRNGIGGIFQYDYWKAVQDHDFRSAGLLNQPPTLLRTSVNHLKAVYRTEGHGLEQVISSALHRKPRLQQAYGQPNPRSDQLYRSDFVHPMGNNAVCAESCELDPRRLVKRATRSEHEDNPVIHYGIIASGNQLMKDATIRDRLAREKDVLCFEMEAAGLMNHFPCLVIRGICDYSDSHKSKEWQGYAAMTAAAYTRDLLLSIPVTRAQEERRLRDVVENIAAAVEVTKANTERTVVHLDRGRENEILDWITPFDYAPVQRENFRKSLAGTCQWFLDSQDLNQWLDTIEPTILCTGIPGAGKTVLTSLVIERLQQHFRDEPMIGLAYIYCDYTRWQEQTPDHMFASILKQLAQRYSFHFTLPEAVRELYDQHLRTQGTTKSKTQPLLAEIITCLPSVISLFSRVYVVVDALDELQTAGGRRSTFLRELLALQKCTGMNILATSRDIPDIQRHFKESPCCEVAAHEEDVQRYVQDQIQHMPDFVQSDTALQDEIQSVICQASRGMFLLAAAHLETLTEQPTPGDLELALQELPRDFYDVYNQSTRRIDQKGPGLRRLAKKALAYVAFARRPVSALELQKAIALKPGTSEMDERFLPSVDMIASVCEGLLSYNTASKHFSLAHHTLQGYLEHQAAVAGWFQEAPANASLARFDFDGSRGRGLDAVAEPVKANRLLGYVASWEGAGEAGKMRENSALSFIRDTDCPKADAVTDAALDRNTLWLLLSRGSY